MYFGHWKPLGVSDQNPRVVKSQSLLHRCSSPEVKLGAPGSTCNKVRNANPKPGSVNHKPRSTNNNPGSTDHESWSIFNHGRGVWEIHHLLFDCCLCALKSNLLLIIPYCLKLRYLACMLINVSMNLYCFPSTHSISGLADCGFWEQFNICLKLMIKWTQRCIWRPWSCECCDALGGHNYANCEAIIEWVWWCMWSIAFCELAEHNRANSDIPLEAVIVRSEKYTPRP